MVTHVRLKSAIMETGRTVLLTFLTIVVDIKSTSNTMAKK
jgi:hypothetical protein